MEYPFSMISYGLAFFADDDAGAREYFDSLPEETQLALLRQDITAGDFEAKMDDLRKKE